MYAQTYTVTLRPDAQKGKDANITYYAGSPNEANTNYGNDFRLNPIVWTISGDPIIKRVLIEFDLSLIPYNAVITNANLSLYYDTTFISPPVDVHSGANAMWIERITSPWDENTVTWNNQPSTTSVNSVSIAASSSGTQDYLDMDVTNLILDMNSSRTDNYGFMLKLQTEQKYRNVVLSSSDHADRNLHPKLVVSYTIPTDCRTININTDAEIVASSPNSNFGNIAKINASSNNIDSIIRGLLYFDLSLIPKDATIISAELSMYHDSTLTPPEFHYGNNAMYIERITSPWNEDSVTWNNQPSTTTLNRVNISASTSGMQHYENMDVTSLISDMHQDRSNSYGLMLKLQTEAPSANVVLASSDNVNWQLRPKLVICYKVAKYCYGFQPDSGKADDVTIAWNAQDANIANTNFAHEQTLMPYAWTPLGAEANIRVLLDNFGISKIPANATITYALLLMCRDTNYTNPYHSGDNAMIIQRITSSWEENTVTWNTQPLTTTTNEVIVPATISPDQNFNIDITNLVTDMIQDPNSYGFMIKLQTEDPYRQVVLASNDHISNTFHPKIELCYTLPIDNHCVILKPDADEGKDAEVIWKQNDTINANANRGTYKLCNPYAWTHQGIPVLKRNLIEFDLSDIPKDITITNATLKMYYDADDLPYHRGNNPMIIERIISPWNENTVTWNTQPLTTTTNQIIVPASSFDTQDYIIDVTDIVADILQEPNSFGFLMKLQTEVHYRQVLLASSDNANKNLHPRLEICYNLNTVPQQKSLNMENVNNENNANITNEMDQNNKKLDFKLYPNPTHSSFCVEIPDDMQGITINMYSILGQKVKSISQNNNNKVTIERENLTEGIYVIHILQNNQLIDIKKITVID